MPQFAFSATDRLGNTVEGTLAAADMSNAAEQVRQMGYTPQRVERVETPITAGVAVTSRPAAQPLHTSSAVQEGTAAHPAAATAAATVPGPIDLTQPITEMPVAGNRTLVPLGGEAEPSPYPERLEPWQRGGPVEQPATPTVRMNADGRVIQPPTPPPIGGTAGVERPRGGERFRSGEIPYGPGTAPQKSFFRRVQELVLFPIFSGVVVKDLAPFFRQFATLINAGLPLYQSLVGLEANTTNGTLKEIAQAGQRQVQAGGRFSDVMAAYPWVFQPLHIQLVRAAEQGGMLDQVLLQIASYIEHELEIRRLISRETFYPKMVMFFALMILGRGGFMGGTMAIVKLVLGGMGRGESYSVLDYLFETIGFGLLCLLPFVAAVIAFRLFLFNMPGVREGYDTFKMAIPGLGNLIKMFAIAKFMRTYSALYRAGFAMGAAVETAGDACGNAVIRNAGRRAVLAAERGGLVSEALGTSGLFPPMAVDMMRTGETSGSLDAMLDNVADYFEAEAKLKSHQLALVFSVLVFLIVALLVGVQIVSFYTGHYGGVGGAGGE